MLYEQVRFLKSKGEKIKDWNLGGENVFKNLVPLIFDFSK